MTAAPRYPEEWLLCLLPSPGSSNTSPSKALQQGIAKHQAANDLDHHEWGIIIGLKDPPQQIWNREDDLACPMVRIVCSRPPNSERPPAKFPDREEVYNSRATTPVHMPDIMSPASVPWVALWQSMGHHRTSAESRGG